MGKETVYSLEGKWTEEVFVSSVEGKSEGLKETLFKVSELNSVVKDVASEEQQEELESRRYVAIGVTLLKVSVIFIFFTYLLTH